MQICKYGTDEVGELMMMTMMMSTPLSCDLITDLEQEKMFITNSEPRILKSNKVEWKNKKCLQRSNKI